MGMDVISAMSVLTFPKDNQRVNDHGLLDDFSNEEKKWELLEIMHAFLLPHGEWFPKLNQ